MRSCPLCGTTKARPLLTTDRTSRHGEAYVVVTCAACGLRFTRPLPDEQEIATLYPESFYGSRTPRRLSWDALRGVLHPVVLRERRAPLAGRVPGRVLDVGCGDGDFLASLRDAGWEVAGVEISPAACARARAKGIEVHQGDLMTAAFPSGRFDAVTFWHVLEHLPEPRRELREARRILRPGGVLVAEVPDADSVTFRVCRERWHGLDVPRHLQHFDRGTVRQLLLRAGFDVVRLTTFHRVDFALVFTSLVNRTGILGRPRGEHYFVGDHRAAGRGRKALFLLAALPLALLSFPWTIVAQTLMGRGESLTVTAASRGAPSP
jgi:SAM-dependent methyltransferase